MNYIPHPESDSMNMDYIPHPFSKWNCTVDLTVRFCQRSDPPLAISKKLTSNKIISKFLMEEELTRVVTA